MPGVPWRMETNFASAFKSHRLLAETRWRISPKGSTSARWISVIRTPLNKPCGVTLKCCPGRGWTIFRLRREFVNGCIRNLSIFSMKKIRLFKFLKYPQPLFTCLCGFLRFFVFLFHFFILFFNLYPSVQWTVQNTCFWRQCFLLLALFNCVFYLSLKEGNNSSKNHHFFSQINCSGTCRSSNDLKKDN